MCCKLKATNLIKVMKQCSIWFF